MFITIFLLLLAGLTITTRGKQSIWFLSLGSVLKTLGLAIPTWVAAVLFPALLGWQCFLMLIFAVAAQAPVNAISGTAALSLLFLAGSFFWYLLLVGLYSLALRSLWSEVPNFLRWLQPPKKKRDIFFGWTALTLAGLVGVTPIVTWVLLSFLDRSMIYGLRYQPELVSQVITKRLESLSELMFITWFIVCAYLYQFRSASIQATAKRKAKRVSA
ncbi:hypothetical protein [Synechocystis sp. PCC 7509]|uniref:hypothetical protein n=1 Tax=Synechocystis sp. PCC 7509 TaxID=927677 RepID=UPI0002ACB148|nr:hypothetical protein [Synechocystis sp. PCC 7509]